MNELLTPSEMGEADRLTIAGGIAGLTLMEAAGRAVADACCRLLCPGDPVLVLAGPGNNGGDGFVAARLLRQRGHVVEVLLLGDRARLKGDAAGAAEAMEAAGIGAVPLFGEALGAGLARASLVVDALFGAGLDRGLGGVAAEAVRQVNESGLPVVAVDLPSGVSGASGLPLVNAEGEAVAIRATDTVTFFRAKPGHYLMPGRSLAGRLEIADIGIRGDAIDRIREGDATAIRLWRNGPDLWRDAWRAPGAETHKYARGHAVVLSGPALATGAARLAAASALRVGAGLVTVASPPSAALVNAAHLTAVMLRPVRDETAFDDLLSDGRVTSLVLGPGAGVGERTAAFSLRGLSRLGPRGGTVVLDADAITSFSPDPRVLFDAISGAGANAILTPHAGEFARLFPDLGESDGSKVERAWAAARRSGAVIVLKGADTVIAAPDGRAAINVNASAWLATAGSGDVLAGTIAGLGAQAVEPFAAAAMGVWLHGEAGAVAGVALTAEDLPGALKPAMERLLAAQVDVAGEGA
ncbi:NAD(P)H-hydrate dehydratase [Stappia sp.]|uniref:NAD(P)H-hydrate dehydratase n=1 Tax=Stappia sp. TaxID=1870903 RepID=UPI0025EDBE85|nr:NAD(P)H-hydrate dehydratase [Stappia sp.]